MRGFFLTRSLFGFVLQCSDSTFTAMQGKPDITHSASRLATSSPHPFRESSHITGVANDGGGEMKCRRREGKKDGGR